MKIHEKHQEEEVNLVLDNARCQKTKLVAQTAKVLNINLIYLPPYSPNLNLLERYWKYVKSKLRTKFFDDFMTTIDSIIAHAAVEDIEAIKSLISMKVQLYDKLEQMNENAWCLNKTQPTKDGQVA
jgi:transposase